MSKKKRNAWILAVLLLLLGDFLYWTMPHSFAKALPEENWTRAQLWYWDEYSDMREIMLDEGSLERILTTAQGTAVTNRPRSRTISMPHFMLYLYAEESLPCCVTVCQNGDVSVAAQLDTDHRRYYDSADALFAALKGVMERSVVLFPAEG